jgi:hypothetical protein
MLRSITNSKVQGDDDDLVVSDLFVNSCIPHACVLPFILSEHPVLDLVQARTGYFLTIHTLFYWFSGGYWANYYFQNHAWI